MASVVPGAPKRYVPPNLALVTSARARLGHRGARPSTPVLAQVIGRSPALFQVCRTVERVAPTDVSVILAGESGTGKELFARAIHGLSPRANRRFVAINCGAIPDNLLESELFGHEKGAFTGALRQTPGKIEGAHGGTLFLDEVGDLPLILQVKLLRFLQERVLERVGGREEIEIDVRVIAATHQNLHQLIERGGFREDLYYRLCELEIAIPPLRARDGDPIVIARHLLDRYNREFGGAVVDFADDALALIDGHSWPGNVRELQNRVKRAVLMADGPMVTAADLGMHGEASASEPIDLRTVRDQAEISALMRALAQTCGNISKAARLLGISRPTLYDLLRQHNLRTLTRAS